MKYVSTRDPERKELSYSEVLLEGLAPDGGLFVPTTIPRVRTEELRYLDSLSYTDLFVAIRGLFIGPDLPKIVQEALVERAYTQSKFPNSTRETIVPLFQAGESLYIQDLSDGPTAAFKDQALQAVGQDMQHVLASGSRSLDILGATSGDTGSAAGASLIGNRAMQLFMLSPVHGPTRFQQAQMAVQSEAGNVHHIHIDSDFTFCQDMVKEIVQDPEFADLGAMNSINWARVASQIPYYFSGYLQAVNGNYGEQVDFVVPTGNFGNVLAGYIAKRMGLPIRNLVVATNENNVLAELINRGEYAIPDSVVETTSPSMDIRVASNYERLFYWLTEGSAPITTEYMEAVRHNKRALLADFGVRNAELLSQGFRVRTSSHADRIGAIQRVYAETSRVIDPHTADAVTAAYDYMSYHRPEERLKVICLSTARPVKFEDTTKEALGFVPERTDSRFIGIEERAREVGGFALLEDIEQVKAFIRAHR